MQKPLVNPNNIVAALMPTYNEYISKIQGPPLNTNLEGSGTSIFYIFITFECTHKSYFSLSYVAWIKKEQTL